jgi:hypothetical protein
MGPIPFRRFKQLVSKHGCHIERRRKEWIVADQNSARVSSFAVTHGKRTQSNQVNPCYVSIFLKEIKERNQS